MSSDPSHLSDSAPDQEPENNAAPGGQEPESTVTPEGKEPESTAPAGGEEPKALRPVPLGAQRKADGEGAKVLPRHNPADAFEQNPLVLASRQPLPEGVARHDLEDGIRVREALRSVIEEGDSLKEAAREWNVAPSSIAEWRARYQDLLQDSSSRPLIELDGGVKDADLTYIPESARGMFLENWERLVHETEAAPADFRQSRTSIFLQTSPLTSWLYQDGELERGIVAGALSGMIAIGILLSFLMAERRPAAAVPLPEPPARDDVAIEQAAGAAQQFWKAGTLEERIKFVRNPEAVRPLMEAYYQEHGGVPVTDAVLSLAMPIRNIVNLSFDVPSQQRSHFLCAVKSRDTFLVDWESSSLYQEAQLAKLRSSRSTEPTRISVTVRKDEGEDYYNYFFMDADQWVCYQLGYPGLEVNLYGYAKKDSPDAIALDAMLEIVDQHAVVMEVRFPPDSQSGNQVEILSLLREEWVPEEP